MLSLDQLEVFRVILSAGSFSKAAEHLYMTPSAISLRIKHMEDVLGVELFERESGRRVAKLTPKGERLNEFATEVLILYRSLERDISSDSEPHSEELIVICGSTTSRVVLPFFRKFQDSYKSIHVRLSHGVRQDIVRAMVEGSAHFGILMSDYEDARFESVPLIRTRLVVLAHRDDPIVHAPDLPGPLSDCEFALASSDLSVRHHADRWALRHGVALNCTLESNNYDDLTEFALHRYGLTILPEFAVRKELASGELVALQLPEMPVDVTWNLNWSRTKAHPVGAELLIQMARQGMPSAV